MNASSASPSQPKLSQLKATQLPLISRGSILRWLRKTHGWVGLWGASLGLLFGLTGILLNHRNVMKIPLAQYEKTHVELALPTQKLTSAKALSLWLQAELKLSKPALKVEDEPAKKVTWNGLSVQQPALWKVDFIHRSIQ